MPEFKPSADAEARGQAAAQAIVTGARRSVPGLFELVIRELKDLDPHVSDEIVVAVHGVALILSHEANKPRPS
ncbi:hypothetical protein ACWFOS_13690 [Gordonia terrae]